MGLMYNLFVKKSYTIILFLFLLLIASCATTDPVEKKIPQKTVDEPLFLSVSEAEADPQGDSVVEFMDTLTVEQKIGQLIIINVREDSSGKAYSAMNDEITERINRISPGGILLFGGSIIDIPQISEFITELQSVSQIPLFISSDVEGGSINRLRSSEKMHATVLPDNALIGEKGDVEAAAIKGGIIAREMFSLGINLNLAPVADVLTNPENTVIGARSFGSDTEMVSQMVANTVMSMRDERVGTVLKHFPGHGDTLKDTHTGSVSVNFDLERLESIEFLPFLSGIDAGTDGIMTAHILVPEITGDHKPATLSYKLITEILRETLRFEGFVMTDSMGMGAITRRWSGGEAAVLAVEAGVDLILNPHTADEAYDALISAVEEGRISKERLDESVYRILKSKIDLGIMDISGEYIYHKDSNTDPQKVLGSDEHRTLAESLF